MLLQRKTFFGRGAQLAISALAYLNIGMALAFPHNQTGQGTGGLRAGEVHMAMNTTKNEARGQALKSELWKVYEELKAAGKLSPAGTDVTQSVLPFVSPGNSFEDAETTLRAAGFTIPPHPKPELANDPNKPRDWYAVVARISPFAESFPFKVSAYVTLLPQSPGNYTIVEKVTARFFVSGP
ncbi:hypothetical protein [Bradyrhizobium sp.]|uniref:hypothetical protein n=1 Tax=Bradyrhizobium sp. TaxID=376 RepID=UPI001D3D097E|nr:hypothetical protein [Bradyrhizobium sp.]MBV8696500.1 hypothetical protein [Bradyrhizobium sp.]MBV8890472.1 hypothetical protein [Acidobacteriota bacterium]MBV8920634.1 hypothetical protein [Bradyrhizobium sp.]